MGHFSVEIMRLPGQLSVEINILTITGAIELLTAHRPAQAQGLTVANDLG